MILNTIITMMKTKNDFICDDLINITSYIDTRYNLESGANQNTIAAVLKKLFKHEFKHKNILFLLSTEHPQKQATWHYYFGYVSNQKLEIEYLFEQKMQMDVFDLLSSFTDKHRIFRLDQMNHIHLKELLNLPDWHQTLSNLLKQANDIQIDDYFFDAERRFYQTSTNTLNQHPLYEHYRKVLTHFRLGGSMTCSLNDDQYHWPHIYFLANQSIEDREDLIFDIDYLGGAIPFSTTFKLIYENLRQSSLDARLDIAPYLRSELFEINSSIQRHKKTQH